MTLPIACTSIVCISHLNEVQIYYVYVASIEDTQVQVYGQVGAELSIYLPRCLSKVYNVVLRIAWTEERGEERRGEEKRGMGREGALKFPLMVGHRASGIGDRFGVGVQD